MFDRWGQEGWIIFRGTEAIRVAHWPWIIVRLGEPLERLFQDVLSINYLLV